MFLKLVFLKKMYYVCKDIKVTDTFVSFTIKKSYKINLKLDKVLDIPL